MPFNLRAIAIVTTAASSLLSATAGAQTRADPTTWSLWRSDALAFPTEMRPAVPELTPERAISFGQFGEDLRLVLPDAANPPTDDDKALRRMADLIRTKLRRARIVSASALPLEARDKTLLLLGTVENNAVLKQVLGASADPFMRGVVRGGYAIGAMPSPFQSSKQCIVAAGADGVGAWSAACVMAFSIHPQLERFGLIENWPVAVGPGAYWVPFEARVTADPWKYEVKPRAGDPPPKPAMPFGVRIWGSPMPTLEGYQRVIRALAAAGVNTVMVQSGGWVDRPDAAKVFTQALDVAWQEGIYTVLYVGNDERSHFPAALSANHKAVVMATRDHPGLLGYQLYNQLAAKLTPDERALVEEQVRWLRATTDKPIGNEVVWGHNVVPIPADKQQLIRDLQSWGNDLLSSDYAPIGGWANEPILSRWEGKMIELTKLGVKPEAVLQAHVPFIEPTVPSREALRNQFWWALVGGATGFYVETAYNFTHFSARGLLTWTGQPQPDGRYDELAALAQIVRKISPTVVGMTALDAKDAAATHVAIAASEPGVALRLKRTPRGELLGILINTSVAKPSEARLTVDADDVAYDAYDLFDGECNGRLDRSRPLSVALPPGGGGVFEFRVAKP